MLFPCHRGVESFSTLDFSFYSILVDIRVVPEAETHATSGADDRVY